MIYLQITGNETDGWIIVKTITNPVNVKGPVTGITWGSLDSLSLEARRTDGFWTQEDVYQGTGDYMVFKEKLVNFDEPTLVVTNTYVYELMPLADIRDNLKILVEGQRESLYYSGFTFNGNTFASGQTNRANIQLMMISALIDPANFPSDLVWDTSDGIQVPMDLATFKLFAKALADFTRNLYIKSRTIKAAIDAATTYEDIRTAATWDDTPL